MGKKTTKQCRKFVYKDSETPDEDTRDVQFTDTMQISFYFAMVSAITLVMPGGHKQTLFTFQG